METLGGSLWTPLLPFGRKSSSGGSHYLLSLCWWLPLRASRPLLLTKYSLEMVYSPLSPSCCDLSSMSWEHASCAPHRTIKPSKANVRWWPSVSSLDSTPESLGSLPLLLQLCSLLPILPIFSLLKYLFISLWQVLVSMWDLYSLLQHTESLVGAYRNKSTVQRLNSGPPALEAFSLRHWTTGNVLPASLPLFSSCLFLAPLLPPTPSLSSQLPAWFGPEMTIWSKWWMGPKKWAVDWRHSFSTNFQNKNYNWRRQTQSRLKTN